MMQASTVGSPQGPAIASSQPVIPPQLAREQHQAYLSQRSELAQQLRDLKSERNSISGQLRVPGINNVDQVSLEKQLVAVDNRITETQKLMADADANVARTAGIPGAVVPPPEFIKRGPPEEVFVLTGMFMVIVLLPMSIALARRIWRRGVAQVMKLPQDLYDHFARLDQSIDAMAIEIERIGEGQRFLTRVLTEQQKVLGQGIADPVEVKEREREKVRG